VALSPTEEELCRTLADRFGQVVGADALAGASVPPLTPTAVRVHITRLRKRIAPLGLTVRAVRGRGYVLGRIS
jgi:DNA-binding response OmpR family regulator